MIFRCLVEPSAWEVPMTTLRLAFVVLLGVAGCTSEAQSGSPGDAAGGGDGGGYPDLGTGCPANQKMCSNACVDADPAHGCGAAQCTPCGGAANATPACANGLCALQCNVGYGDCDNNATNGCE